MIHPSGFLVGRIIAPKSIGLLVGEGESGGGPYGSEYVSMTDKEKVPFLKEISKGGNIHF